MLSAQTLTEEVKQVTDHLLLKLSDMGKTFGLVPGIRNGLNHFPGLLILPRRAKNHTIAFIRFKARDRPQYGGEDRPQYRPPPPRPGAPGREG